MPGPLFNFAAFLGAAAGYKAYATIGEGILGAALCWLGLFGPGVMLIFGILPWWGHSDLGSSSRIEWKWEAGR